MISQVISRAVNLGGRIRACTGDSRIEGAASKERGWVEPVTNNVAEGERNAEVIPGRGVGGSCYKLGCLSVY